MEVAHPQLCHAALETAGRDPHKGDAVAVRRVDIGLHLEDETGDLGLLGRDRAGIGRLRARRRRELGHPAQ